MPARFVLPLSCLREKAECGFFARHCEERSDEAIQNGAAVLDCFAAVRNDEMRIPPARVFSLARRRLQDDVRTRNRLARIFYFYFYFYFFFDRPLRAA
jgi:hypothetical protein